MSKTFNKKGMEFVPKTSVSEDTKSKLDKLTANKMILINKLVEDYRAGKLVAQ